MQMIAVQEFIIFVFCLGVIPNLAKISGLIVSFGDDEAECGVSRYHERLWLMNSID
jgi:hypothetical protein